MGTPADAVVLALVTVLVCLFIVLGFGDSVFTIPVDLSYLHREIEKT